MLATHFTNLNVVSLASVMCETRASWEIGVATNLSTSGAVFQPFVRQQPCHLTEAASAISDSQTRADRLWRMSCG
jgi:hypothetical protein